MTPPRSQTRTRAAPCPGRIQTRPRPPRISSPTPSRAGLQVNGIGGYGCPYTARHGLGVVVPGVSGLPGVNNRPRQGGGPGVGPHAAGIPRHVECPRLPGPWDRVPTCCPPVRPARLHARRASSVSRIRICESPARQIGGAVTVCRCRGEDAGARPDILAPDHAHLKGLKANFQP